MCPPAFIICCGSALPSTPNEFVSRLTEQAVTPSTFDTAFSTLALHAAHDIPFTLYCRIVSPLFQIQERSLHQFF